MRLAHHIDQRKMAKHTARQYDQRVSTFTKVHDAKNSSKISDLRSGVFMIEVRKQ